MIHMAEPAQGMSDLFFTWEHSCCLLRMRRISNQPQKKANDEEEEWVMDIKRKEEAEEKGPTIKHTNTKSGVPAPSSSEENTYKSSLATVDTQAGTAHWTLEDCEELCCAIKKVRACHFTKKNCRFLCCGFHFSNS